MPFPIPESEILKTEQKLGLTFPASFRAAMMQENGGEIITDEDEWEIRPFLDTTDRKRLSRTCNDILQETKAAKEWGQFPGTGVAIAANGCGDHLFFLPSASDPARLDDKVYAFWHEEARIECIAESFAEIERM